MIIGDVHSLHKQSSVIQRLTKYDERLLQPGININPYYTTSQLNISFVKFQYVLRINCTYYLIRKCLISSLCRMKGIFLFKTASQQGID